MNALANETWIYHGDNQEKSSADNVIFIYNHKNVFISDNHLTAFWCWLQICNPNLEYQFVHIDYHDDTAYYRDVYNCFQYTKELQVLKNYIDLKGKDGRKVFQWDTYIMLAEKVFPQWFNQAVFMTKECPGYNINGKCSDISGCCKHYSNEKGMIICYICEGVKELDKQLIAETPIILNIDIDYFFACEDKHRCYSDSEVESFSKELNSMIQSHDVAVCTIALSPEVCGGWDNVLGILSIMCKHVPSLVPENFVCELSRMDAVKSYRKNH